MPWRGQPAPLILEDGLRQVPSSSTCLNRTERERPQNIQGQKVAINTSRGWSGWRPWGERTVITQSGIRPGPPKSTRGHWELSRKPRPSYLLPMKRREELKSLSGGGICSPWLVLIFVAGLEPENQESQNRSPRGEKKIKTPQRPTQGDVQKLVIWVVNPQPTSQRKT